MLGEHKRESLLAADMRFWSIPEKVSAANVGFHIFRLYVSQNLSTCSDVLPGVLVSSDTPFASQMQQ
jgi:hypothetical protein